MLKKNEIIQNENYLEMENKILNESISNITEIKYDINNLNKIKNELDVIDIIEDENFKKVIIPINICPTYLLESNGVNLSSFKMNKMESDDYLNDYQKEQNHNLYIESMRLKKNKPCSKKDNEDDDY